MSVDMMTLLTGIFFLLASLFVGVREILLRPENTKFPKVPFWVSLSLFVYCIALFLAGTSLIFSVYNRAPLDQGALFLIVAAAIALHNLATLANVLTQRYPPRVWERLHLIAYRAKCQRKAAAGLFSHRG